MNDMEIIENIKNDINYKIILRDSFGGICFDVENIEKYNKNSILTLWNALSENGKDAAGGIMAGVINFLKEVK